MEIILNTKTRLRGAADGGQGGGKKYFARVVHFYYMICSKSMIVNINLIKYSNQKFFLWEERKKEL